MDRPTMNMQKVAQCVKRGKSRAACMKEIYPDGMPPKGGGKKKGGKKPPMRGGY